MASWDNNERSSLSWEGRIAIGLIVFAIFGAIALVIHSTNAGASDPPWGNTLEGRVNHLESELNDAYHNQSDTNAHVIRLIDQVNSLEEYRDNLVGGIRQLMQRVNALERAQARSRRAHSNLWNGLRVCFRARAYVGATIEDNNWLMAQCLDDYTYTHTHP
jgi:hypothetical protein